MAGSFYPQSGVVRRAQSVAPPAPAARTTPAPLTGLPHAVGLLARDDLDRGERAALGNLGLYGVAAAELGPRTRVVDVGCGDGLGAEWLTRYYQDVVAIDSSVSAAESARRNAPRATVHCADFVTESALGRAEAAVAIDVLGYVPAPEDVLAALQRALTPDAVVFLAEPRAHVAQCPAPHSAGLFAPVAHHFADHVGLRSVAVARRARRVRLLFGDADARRCGPLVESRLPAARRASAGRRPFELRARRGQPP